MAPSKKKPTTGRYLAAVGLNVGTDDGEVRYDAGDIVDAEHVDTWMLEDGVVVDSEAPEPTPDVEHEDEVLDQALIDSQAQAADEVGAGQSHDDGGEVSD